MDDVFGGPAAPSEGPTEAPDVNTQAPGAAGDGGAKKPEEIGMDETNLFLENTWIVSKYCVTAPLVKLGGVAVFVSIKSDTVSTELRLTMRRGAESPEAAASSRIVDQSSARHCAMRRCRPGRSA